MLVKILGTMDLASAVIIFLLAKGIISGGALTTAWLFVVLYLFVKALLFIKDLASAVDLATSLMVFFGVVFGLFGYGLFQIIAYISCIWLLQKGIRSVL